MVKKKAPRAWSRDDRHYCLIARLPTHTPSRLLIGIHLIFRLSTSVTLRSTAEQQLADSFCGFSAGRCVRGTSPKKYFELTLAYRYSTIYHAPERVVNACNPAVLISIVIGIDDLKRAAIKRRLQCLYYVCMAAQ